MPQDDINRRNVLSKITGGAAATGIFSTVSFNVAAAEEVDGNVAEEDPVVILEGDEKRSLATELSKTPEFGKLLDTAQSKGYSLKWDIDNLYAGRTEADSFRREVASYNLLGGSSDEHAAINIGRDLTDGSIIFANFDVEHLDERGVAEKTVRYEIVDPGSEIEVEQKVIESNPRAKEQFITELERNSPSTQGVTPDIPDDFPVELDIGTCSGCYYASTLVCRNLCGAGGGFLCGLLGISIVGGVSCVTFVGAVCWVAGKAPSCAEPVAATICKSTGLGICGPNEKPGSPLDVDIPQF